MFWLGFIELVFTVLIWFDDRENATALQGIPRGPERVPDYAPEVV
jgi:hypothetical protein